MPTIEIRIPSLGGEAKRRLTAAVADAFVAEGIDIGDVSLFFHHASADEVALGGEYPFHLPYARVAIFAGGVDDEQKRRIAAHIGDALFAAGIPETRITVAFRPIDPRGIFVGRGESPW